MNLDIINGLFELFGSIVIWLSVTKILKDKKSRGISFYQVGFFNTWGFWNLYYYPSLDQWASFFAGLVLVAGNTVWFALILKYRKN